MQIPFPPLIPCPPPILRATHHVIRHTVKIKRAVAHGWRHVTRPVHYIFHTATAHIQPAAGTACQYAPHFLAATLLAFAPASQATRVPDTLPVSLPDVRTTDNSPAPDDTGVWPPMPRVPVIPIMGTGPGSTIETFDTPAGDPTAVPADPGRVSDPSIPGLPTVLASQADPVSVPEPTSALLLALPLGALLVASARRRSAIENLTTTHRSVGPPSA